MAKLSDLEIDEVSLVRKGANQHSRVVIAKSGESEGDNVDEYFDIETGEPVDLSTLEFGTRVQNADGEVFEWTEDAEEVDPERELASVGKSFFETRKTAPVSKAAESLKVQLSKALTDSERDQVIAKAFEQMDELSKQASEAQEIAKAEREQRRYGEYLELSKSYSLPASDEELALAMMHAEDLLPAADVAVIAKCFSAASSALFDEQGRVGGGDNDDIMAKVSAVVDGQISKSGETSREAATAAAFDANPELYSEWTAEHYGYRHGR